MSKTLLQKLDRERSLVRSREPKTIEQLCRITLAADASGHVDIPWCEGLGKKTILYVLEPGKSIVWPLNRTRAYFGPFDLYTEYEATTDERKLTELRDIISSETARYLNRYDYPRDNRTGQPVGPHRAPDVTVEIVRGDGSYEPALRLYEVYGIGEFDDLAFDRKPTEEELRTHYEAQLRERDVVLEAARREMAELKGMIMGSGVAAHKGAPARRPHPADCQCAAHRGKNGAKDQAELAAV